MSKFQKEQLALAASAERAAAKQPSGSTLRLVYEKAAQAHRRMAQFPSLRAAKAATA